MSPRTASSSSSTASSSLRSASAPYSRRPSGQPKSTRQQFSACGACRMRRVRCDLKDLPIGSAGPHPSCSNCKERGLKCVDEFADVKAVKLLRRGRRLQQVEAIYGKANDTDGAESSLSPGTRLPSLIPHLQAEFFTSPFWSWFSVQRPILDPIEFSARFYAHTKGTHSLGHEGGLLAMILVVWAASFGVNECGVPIEEEDSYDTQSSRRASARPKSRGDAMLLDHSSRLLKEKTDAMIKEILELVDFHGVMRRPTWDGVRMLLLLLPLLEESHPLEKLAMYEATISHAHVLCTFPSSITQSTSVSDDSIVRARIYWYVHMQEGITTGLRGGRLVLTEDDLELFQNSLPQFNLNISPGISSSLSTPFPQTASGLPGDSTGSTSSLNLDIPNGSYTRHSTHPYFHMSHLFSIPLHLGSVCRKIHAVLTGPKATRMIEDSGGMKVDADGMNEVWDGLQRCWDEFEGVRRGGLASGDVDPMVERFVCGWQIFIFECHNIIRETLKQYATNSSPPSPHSMYHSSHSPSSTLASAYSPSRQLQAIATRHCMRLLPFILDIIKKNLGHLNYSSDMEDPTGLFKWDTGLVRDGVFFAGYLTANMSDDSYLHRDSSPSRFSQAANGSFSLKQESSDVSMETGGPHMHHANNGSNVFTAEDGVRICITAIGEMRWAFSKREEREENIRHIWQDNQLRNHGSAPSNNQVSFNQAAHPSPSTIGLEYSQHNFATLGRAQFSDHVQHSLLPPLSLVAAGTRIDSAPTTASSSNSSGGSGWPSYTPPGTATSGTSGGTGISARASPVFPPIVTNTMPVFKPDGADAFYHVANDMDQFNFSSSASGGVGPVINGYTRSPISGTSTGHAFLDFTSSQTGGLSDDVTGCTQFAEDTFYH